MIYVYETVKVYLIAW